MGETTNVFAAGNLHALQTLAFALDEAKQLEHPVIGPEHLLLGLLRLEKGTVVSILKANQVNLDRARIRIEQLVPKAQADKVPGTLIPYSPESKRGLWFAAKEATRLQHAHIGPEHLLLGLLMADEGIVARVLESFGVRPEIIREEILKQLPPGGRGPGPEK